MKTSFSLRLGVLAAALVPALAVTLASFGGCDPSQISVHGRVTAGGTPLPGGSVRFVLESSDQPAADIGDVVDGDYSIIGSDKLVPGKYVVQILAAGQDLAPLPADSTGLADRGSPTWIPSQYNSHSVLRVEITGGRSHRFDFDLKF
jgi:hypothetical protein